MSLKASNKVDTNKYEVEISIDSAAFCDAIQKVYKKEVKNITIKGFRKGKAPLHMIEKLYGEGVFFDDALNYLYEGALLSAIDEAGLKIVDVEKTDVVSVSKAEGAELKVTVIVEPEVELGEYKGLAAERVTPVVTDEEVEASLMALLLTAARARAFLLPSVRDSLFPALKIRSLVTTPATSST